MGHTLTLDIPDEVYESLLRKTSGWATFFVRTEPLHAAAAAYMRQGRADGTHVVTTNYVLTELIALLISPLRIPRSRQITIIDAIKTASWVEVVHIDRTLDEEAW
jgi:predicted nucleic acid-binding protein